MTNSYSAKKLSDEGRDIYPWHYPPGVFFKGCEKLARKFKGYEKLAWKFKGYKKEFHRNKFLTIFPFSFNFFK